jgi:hypothetical protein
VICFVFDVFGTERGTKVNVALRFISIGAVECNGDFFGPAKRSNGPNLDNFLFRLTDFYLFNSSEVRSKLAAPRKSS